MGFSSGLLGRAKLNNSIGTVKKNNYIMPTPKPQAYVSPYAADIQKLQSTIQNRQPFAYNPGTDVGLQTAQDNAINTVSRGAARRNMIYSDSNKAQMNQSALNLVPQFENAAFSKYQDEGNNLTNQLNNILALENNNYGRYRDTLTDTRYNDEITYNRGLDKVNRQDSINSEMGYVNPYGNVQINPKTTQYANNYQSEIDRRRLTPDTEDNSLIVDLEAARANKVFSNPEMLKKFGDPYRTQASRDNDFNRGVTEAGLTGMYGGKPTADQIYRDKTYNLDERQTNASINNMSADNARQNQASSKYERIGPLYSQMMQSGDPSSWLAKNASIMTGDELDALLNYAPKQGKTDYKTNPNFSDELKNISKNKDDFYKMLSNDPQSFINEYGWEGYQELYQRSKPTASGGIFGGYNFATP